MDAGMQIKELAGILSVTSDTVGPSSITALALSFTNLLFRFFLHSSPIIKSPESGE